jgi:aminoglycoside N3'-acetyltransferase
LLDPYRTIHTSGPWRKLLDWQGKILFLGDVIGANTYLHALEAWLLNYLEYSLARVTIDGQEEEVPIVDYPGGCREWYGQRKDAAYFRKLEPLGLYRESKVGEAPVSVLDVREFTRAMHEALSEDPELLLHKSACARCAQGRSRLT